jgi:hypothetical protein
MELMWTMPLMQKSQVLPSALLFHALLCFRCSHERTAASRTDVVSGTSGRHAVGCIA